MTITVDPCQRRQDIRCRMSDERSVVIGEQDTILFNEVEQVGHLLKVGGNVRVITPEVCVVELNIDHVLNVAASRIEHATARRLRDRGRMETWQSPNPQ